MILARTVYTEATDHTDDYSLAVAFCYLETLSRPSLRHKFTTEITRLKSTTNIMAAAGFPEHVYEDFADEMFEAMEEIAAANDDGAVLLAAFNDNGKAMSIITYLKVRLIYILALDM